MRKVLLLLTLLVLVVIGISVFSNEPYVDPVLRDAYKDFKKHARKNNYRLAKNVDSIIIAPDINLAFLMGKPVWGVIVFNDNGKYTISIGEAITKDYKGNAKFINAILYHEMFHAETRIIVPHCNQSDENCPVVLNAGLDPAYVILFWDDSEKELYFNYLKTLK